jgi:hypothetical protein
MRKINSAVNWRVDKVTGEKDAKGPMLFCKVQDRKTKTGEINVITSFFGADNQPVDPLTLLGQKADVRAVVKIDTIYVGAKISLQIKLYEAEVAPLDSVTRPRLLSPLGAPSAVVPGSNPGPVPDLISEDEESDADSEDSMDFSVPVAAPVPTPVTAKREAEPAKPAAAKKVKTKA